MFTLGNHHVYYFLYLFIDLVQLFLLIWSATSISRREGTEHSVPHKNLVKPC